MLILYNVIIKYFFYDIKQQSHMKKKHFYLFFSLFYHIMNRTQMRARDAMLGLMPRFPSRVLAVRHHNEHMSGFAAFYYILKKSISIFLKIETKYNHIVQTENIKKHIHNYRHTFTNIFLHVLVYFTTYHEYDTNEWGPQFVSFLMRERFGKP